MRHLTVTQAGYTLASFRHFMYVASAAEITSLFFCLIPMK
ncbi:hypothetical protein XCR1_1200039 [Xenorhabdus cabanillasii JM26]|uniref:Uncharacterized protein n=1 Tax=Xenorhabdus cabanillasii JM26 TaxID=1427517 RepID=W1IML1_9GAMM|nr:hypothetical protein XCR1_1200039 [Xenorhabdus cabanillasii JM26]